MARATRAIHRTALIYRKRPERRAQLLHEELRLFPRREVPALVDLVEVERFGYAALRPAARRLVKLVGEDGDGRRDGEVLGAEVVGLFSQ